MAARTPSASCIGAPPVACAETNLTGSASGRENVSVRTYYRTMANVVTPSSRTQPSLTTAEIAALALSLARLGAGPQAAVARRAIRHLIDEVHPADDVVIDTLTTLTEPLDDTTADRARVIAAAI